MNFLDMLLGAGIITDAKLVLSSAQAQTSVATHDSTYALDFGVANPNVGLGTPLWVTVAVETALSGASGTTLKIMACDAADGSTYSVLFATSIMTAAGVFMASQFTVAAGTKLLDIPLPSSVRRYFKLQYTIGTTVMASGKWDAYVSMGGGQ